MSLDADRSVIPALSLPPLSLAPALGTLRRVAARGITRLALRSALGLGLGLGLALGTGIGVSTAQANPGQTLSGSEETAFREALDLWLADDEAQALPLLAALAQDGNAAARFLLAQIDKSPALQGPTLSLMHRDERIELLRAPGGLSGRSWMNELAEYPLAEAWLTLRHTGAGPEVIGQFNALGEPRAARVALAVLAAREHQSLSHMDLDAVDGELLYLLWRVAGPERRAEIAGRVHQGDAQRQLMGESLDARDLDQWLRQSSAAAPLDAVCAIVCPGERASCLSAAYQALGSHNALLTLGTPAETLISQDAFLASDRGRATVIRRMLLSTTLRGRRSMLARVSGESSCLADALVAEAERFRPQRLAPAQPIPSHSD